VETGEIGRRAGGRSAVEEPDHRHRQLLRKQRQRPTHCSAANQRDEVAPSLVSS
jgi:hypothetical protein